MAAAGLLSPLQWEIGGWAVNGVSDVDVASVVSWFVVGVVIVTVVWCSGM